MAPDLRAEHVLVADAQMVEAWLRASQWERCELDGCDLTGADLYGARVADSKLRGCSLAGTELSTATFARTALHGSTFEGARGADALRGTTIGPGQIVDLALPLFAALDITVAEEDP